MQLSHLDILASLQPPGGILTSPRIKMPLATAVDMMHLPTAFTNLAVTLK